MAVNPLLYVNTDRYVSDFVRSNIHRVDRSLMWWTALFRVNALLYGFGAKLNCMRRRGGQGVGWTRQDSSLLVQALTSVSVREDTTPTVAAVGHVVSLRVAVDV